MLGNVIVLGSKGHCQLEEERIIHEDVEAEGDGYLECIEDDVEAEGDDYPESIEEDVEELDSDFERDLGTVSGSDGDYLEHEREKISKGRNLTSTKEPAINNNNGGKRKRKLLKVKVQLKLRSASCIKGSSTVLLKCNVIYTTISNMRV